MERALVVTVKIHSDRDNWRMEDLTQEIEELVASTGAECVENITCMCEKPTANFLIGKGKAEEIAAIAQELDVNTVIFSYSLSGTQQRNLEEVIGKKVIDRTQLILHIFARHAKTPEGKAQVELAQLEYLMPRLIGKGLVLSRTGGGIGTSGPGEQALEIDRRRIRKKIEKLQGDLVNMLQHRDLLRNKRKEKALATIALVGYTNAGKSTLLNALTGAGQVVADKLFTTLDPMSKGLVLSNGEHIVVSDTVGFIHDLPHHLVEAFKATLEEVADADLLIHVVDVSHPLVYEHSKAVFEVLKQLGADEKKIITALNKIDLLDDAAWLAQLKKDFDNAIAISARSGENLHLLLKEIESNFASRMTELELMLPMSKMSLMSLFYREGKVEKAEYLPGGIKVKLRLPNSLARKIMQDPDIKRKE